MATDTAAYEPAHPLHDLPAAEDDLLWRQLKTIPAFRAVLRAVESRFYFSVDLPEPVLDVGCGDGHFSQMTFSKNIAAGIDPWWNPLKKSVNSQMYDVLAQALGDRLPFPDNHFAGAFSNSVVEHIPDIQPVLNEVNRVMQPNGRFLITLPSQYFTEWLGGAAFFEKLGSDGLAERYRRFFNDISRHEHTDPPDVWASRLAFAGFEIERWQYYFSKEALRALEMGHAQGVPAAVMHAITGHWIVAPWPSSLGWTERWLRPFYEEEAEAEAGAYLLIIAKKVSRRPITASLPPAQPFTVSELEANLPYNTPAPEQVAETFTPGPAFPAPETIDLPEAIPPAAAEPEPSTNAAEAESEDEPRTNFLAFGLIGFTLLLALWGQTALNRDPSNPLRGLGWYLAAAVPLVILLWRQHTIQLPAWRGSLPDITHISRKRWWVFGAVFLSFVAYRFVRNLGGERPLIAVILWLAAIGLGWYALSGQRLTTDSDTQRPFFDKFTLVTAVGLFITALILRFYNLSHHPFILNGIEASLGLNVGQIINGQINNPFGTAWLTNPTLPLYFMSFPVRILGQTVLAIRFLSPFIGGLTVVTTFLLGQRLYGRAVGLVAAVLLLGSHFHLQYSRLGLTNIWDPLLVLLSLGLLAVAWERAKHAPRQRRLWLLVGLSWGLSAYSFTTVHLLPIMLVAIFLYMLLVNRTTLKAQTAHLFTAVSLAFIIALPAILFYRNYDTIFMERANILGILDSQSGWLSQTAAGTAESQLDLFQQQFWLAALAFNGSKDISPTFQPNTPLLNFGTSVLFVLGVFIALLSFRKLKFSLLLIWILVPVVFAGALLVDPPQSHRLLIALPAVILLAGIALVTIAKMIATALQSNTAEPETAPPDFNRVKTALAIVAGIALLFALMDVSFYFGRYTQVHNFGDKNTEAAYEISTYLNQLDGDWQAHFYGPPVMYTSFPTFPYLLTDFQENINFFNVEDTLPSLTSPAPNHIFIFLPERISDLTAVQAAYPDGHLETFDGYHSRPLFHAYRFEPLE